MEGQSDPPGSSAELEGRYSNHFQVGYNEFEFVVECGQKYGDEPLARLQTRIITAPAFAKALFTLLQRSVEDYESAFGAIRE
jgi:hypothetical protein